MVKFIKKLRKASSLQIKVSKSVYTHLNKADAITNPTPDVVKIR